jgi:membrane protease YdiL (CAAX protease family)
MALIGQDFRAALRGPLYATKSGQHPALAIFVAGLLFVAYTILQTVMGLLLHAVIYGGVPSMAGDLASRGPFLKSMVVGIFPAALISVGLAWWAAGWWNKTGDRGLALHLPELGALGWLAVIVGFIVLMYVIFALTFVILGIDPKDYMPSAGGLNDQSSMAGVIEKTIADLADEPVLFALAIPGIAFGAPIVEEFIFRGALFSALRRTWLGGAGALVITSAVWAVIHGATAPWLVVGLLFLMGLVLGAVLLRFGSIWVPVILHCVWNGMVSLSLLSLVGNS